MVPGTFTWSIEPVRSSAATAKSREGVRATQAMQRDGNRLRQVARRFRLAAHHVRHLGRQQVLVGEEAEQPPALMRPLLEQKMRLAGGDHADLAADIDVVAAPPAGQRVEVVRGEAGQRLARIGVGRQEEIVALLEEEDAVALDLDGAHHVAETRRHDAEILADDDGAARLRDLGERREHAVEGVADIDAVGGGKTVGDPEQPVEAHRMVDADARRRGGARCRARCGTARNCARRARPARAAPGPSPGPAALK